MKQFPDTLRVASHYIYALSCGLLSFISEKFVRGAVQLRPAFRGSSSILVQIFPLFEAGSF